MANHMFRKFSVHPLCYTLVFVAAAFFPAVAYSATRVIIAFGDSLTAGCWNTEVEDSSCGIVPRQDVDFESYDYGDQLQDLLVENNYGYVIHNFGKGGETTIEGLERFDSVLENSCNRGAKYILIMEGTNDLLHKENKNYITFNLGVMMEKSMARGVIPLVATIPPDLTPGHEYKDIPEMNSLIRELVEEKRSDGEVYLVDQYEALHPYWEFYTDPRSCYASLPGRGDDQLHPNAKGTSAMGTVWYESLSRLLPRSMPWLMLLLADD